MTSRLHSATAIGFGALTLAVAGFIVGVTSEPHWTVWAAAVLLAGWAAAFLHWRSHSVTGFWLGLTILGAAASLQLTEAGPRVAYQHLTLPWEVGTDLRRIALACLALQAGAVLWYWMPRIGEAWRWVTGRVATWRVILFAIIVALPSATVSKDIGRFLQELSVAAVLQVIALGSIVAAISTLPLKTREHLAQRCWQWLGKDTTESIKAPRLDLWAITAAVIVVLICATLALTVYQRHPHVPDEVAYLIHARYFAEGWLTMPVPPIPEAFDLDLMTYEASRWYSPTPPGWPAVLAIGAFFGVPWLVNPILAGVSVVLTYLLVSGLYDRVTGRLTLVLLVTSPWFLFLGMSFMTHMLSFACALGAAVAVARIRRGGSLWWSVPGGVGLAMLGINRPLEGLIVSALLGLWVLGGAGRSRAARITGLGALGLIAAAGAGLTLPYNHALTGDPMTFPIMAYTDSLYGPGANALGFGSEQGLGWGGLDPFPGHSPFEALINTNMNAFAVNVELLGWSTGSFIFVWALVLFGRLRRPDYWLSVSIAAIILVHGFYWFSGGPDFGARYWALMLVPALTLAARGVIAVSGSSGVKATPWGHQGILLIAICLAAISTMVFVPWRAVDKYYHYRGMRPDIRTLARQYEFGRSVVLIRGKRHPDYASAAVFNPLDLSAERPIYVWDRGPDMRRAVAESFPDRPVWVVDGPTRSGGTYEVVAGPLPQIPLADPDGGS